MSRLLAVMVAAVLVTGGARAWSQSQTSPAGPEMITYYIGLLKRGPQWTRERTPRTMEIQKGHMDHMNKTAAEGKLVVAGPIGDDGDLRGILVYKVSTLEEARALAEADPAVKAGRLSVEIHPWLVEKGYLP